MRSPARPRAQGSADIGASRAALIAREEEREQLARELHDGLSAELTALRYALARLAPMPDDMRSDLPSTAALADADAALSAAFQEIRRLIDERMPLSPARDPIVHLRSWITAFAQRIAIDITFECPLRPPPGSIDPDVGIALLRITQEALNNIAKHAGATAVLVRLDFLPDNTILIVRDNGRGLPSDKVQDQLRQMTRHDRVDGNAGRDVHDVQRGGGIGLSSMHQRCEALGGTLKLRPVPGSSGLEIQATLPAVQLTQ